MQWLVHFVTEGCRFNANNYKCEHLYKDHEHDALVMLWFPVWGVHEGVEGKKNQYNVILQYIVWQCCINSETARISILLY